MVIPVLKSNIKSPVLELESHILENISKIEHWFRVKWTEYQVPFYGSVDLRNSGFKLAPVDMNLFPGGFNNLHASTLPLSIQAVTSAIEKICPKAGKILLIPENHTRNQFYLKNVYELKNILETAGFEIRLGTFIPDLKEALAVDLDDQFGGHQLVLEPIHRENNRLYVGEDKFNPCFILLNNDLSAGLHELLIDLEQEVYPKPQAGWYNRSKKIHFDVYNQVAEEFANLIGIDPWLINPYFSTCNDVDFIERQGEDSIADHVEKVLNQIQEKYTQYGIDQKPFVIVKASQGTYGMGIMTAKSPEDVKNLNRKQRNKMSVVKEGQQVSEVLIQEGVYTFEEIDDGVAEPVVYMIDHFVVGGFYRVHTGRGIDENLNAPGMHFVPVAFETPCTLPNHANQPDSEPNLFYTYGVIARLSLLASAIEIQNYYH